MRLKGIYHPSKLKTLINTNSHRFMSLPPELILEILQLIATDSKYPKLLTPDLFRCRLVCHRLDNLSLQVLSDAARSFPRYQTIIYCHDGCHSVDALERISRQNLVSKSIKRFGLLYRTYPTELQDPATFEYCFTRCNHPPSDDEKNYEINQRIPKPKSVLSDSEWLPYGHVFGERIPEGVTNIEDYKPQNPSQFCEQCHRWKSVDKDLLEAAYKHFLQCIKIQATMRERITESNVMEKILQRCPKGLEFTLCHNFADVDYMDNPKPGHVGALGWYHGFLWGHAFYKTDWSDLFKLLPKFNTISFTTLNLTNMPLDFFYMTEVNAKIIVSFFRNITRLCMSVEICSYSRNGCQKHATKEGGRIFALPKIFQGVQELEHLAVYGEEGVYCITCRSDTPLEDTDFFMSMVLLSNFPKLRKIEFNLLILNACNFISFASRHSKTLSDVYLGQIVLEKNPRSWLGILDSLRTKVSISTVSIVIQKRLVSNLGLEEYARPVQPKMLRSYWNLFERNVMWQDIGEYVTMPARLVASMRPPFLIS